MSPAPPSLGVPPLLLSAPPSRRLGGCRGPWVPSPAGCTARPAAPPRGGGWGGGKLVPSWLSLSRIPMSFPRVSPGFPKAAWALRPLSVRVPLGRSWPAGPQAVDGVNGGRQTRHEFVRLGWGTGEFLGNQAGNTTHSAKPGRACKC